jgi:hypothetical protein
MVDADGFIACLPDTPLQPAFRPVVDEVIGLLHARLGAQVHSIYLYGSVKVQRWRVYRISTSA